MKRTSFTVSLVFTAVYTLLAYGIIDEIDYQVRIYNVDFIYECGIYSNLLGGKIYVWEIMLAFFILLTWFYVSLMKKLYRKL